MRRPVLAWILLVVSLAATGCQVFGIPLGERTAADSAPATLTVFAAASLTDAFEEIGQKFAAGHGNPTVVFNFAGSNQLATQIGEGAPADVFASANRAQMQAAIDSGRIVSGTEQTFARNGLVVVTPADNPGGPATLQELARPGVKLVLAAKEVPVGQYTLDFLDKAAQDGSLGAGYKAAVLANVVSYEESVRSVLAKVALGEADAGIVYRSDAAAGAEKVNRIEIPDALNTIATYPIAVVSDSPHGDLARQFVAYVLSAEGQQVLAKYGLLGAR